MKNISFKKILLVIKNNYSINRSLPLILALGLAILGSVVGAMPISDIESRYSHLLESGFVQYEEYKMSVDSLFEEMLGMDGAFSIMLMITVFALAFFSVIALMGFMRDKSGTDFYHALSMNRKEIYLAHYLTALINGALTVILTQALGLFFMDLIAKDPPYSFGQMLVMQLPVIAVSLLYLALFIALAMIAAVISGTVFSTLISYAFINFYLPATVLAVALAGNSLFNSQLLDYLEHKPHIYPYSSPLIRYIFGISGDDYFPFTPLTFILLALGIVVTLCFGIWLYTKKKNENSLKPMAFSVFKRPLQYLIAFDAVLLGATFFEAITNSLIWCLVGGLIALLFTFIATNAFFDKSFTGVFKKSKHMAFILILTLVFGAVFVADVFGIYREVKPDITKIENASLYFNYETIEGKHSYDFYFDNDEAPWSETVENIDGGAKKEIMELYSFVKELQEKRNGKAYEYINYDEEKFYEFISVSMNFRCKNDFSSYYAHIYLSEGEEGFNELKQILERLSDSYSHVLSYSNKESGEWVNQDIIK